MYKMSEQSLLRVESLKKYFPYRKGFGRTKNYIRAVDGISFDVRLNSVFAIVGESGSGKSTVANLILRLTEPTEGKIYFKESDVLAYRHKSLREYRKSVQMIFQDPYASLNPRMRIIDVLGEPFKIHGIPQNGGLKKNVLDLLERVGMGADSLNKYPHEFSGGQRQRICIARAIAVSPELLIADEPLSALDVSIQAQILNLFHKIKEESAISFIFISHDLKVVRFFSDEVAVMYLGKFVEQAKTEEIFSTPLHPYTKLLIASAPRLRKKQDKSKTGILYTGVSSHEVQSQIAAPSGCLFHPRCPERIAICSREHPQTKDIKGRLVSCHLF